MYLHVHVHYDLLTQVKEKKERKDKLTWAPLVNPVHKAPGRQMLVTCIQILSCLNRASTLITGKAGCCLLLYRLQWGALQPHVHVRMCVHLYWHTADFETKWPKCTCTYVHVFLTYKLHIHVLDWWGCNPKIHKKTIQGGALTVGHKISCVVDLPWPTILALEDGRIVTVMTCIQ